MLPKEVQYLSDTIRERPLPAPPLEDTMNSNLNNDSNLKSLVDNLFQTNRRENTSFEFDDLGDSKVKSGAKRNDRDFLFSQLNNITYLLAKICEKVEIVEQRVSTVQSDVDRLRSIVVEQGKMRTVNQQMAPAKQNDSNQKGEIDELVKLLKSKDEQLSQRESENKLLKDEIKAAAIDKDILLKLINQLVDSNSENLQIVQRELKINQPG